MRPNTGQKLNFKVFWEAVSQFFFDITFHIFFFESHHQDRNNKKQEAILKVISKIS